MKSLDWLIILLYGLAESLTGYAGQRLSSDAAESAESEVRNETNEAVGGRVQRLVGLLLLKLRSDENAEMPKDFIDMNGFVA